MKKFIFMMIIAFVITGCNNLGSTIVVGDLTVYYKSGVTIDEAKKVGMQLHEMMNNVQADVMLLKEGDKYILKVIENIDAADGISTEFQTSFFDGLMKGLISILASEDNLNSAEENIEIYVCNQQFETQRVIKSDSQTN